MTLDSLIAEIRRASGQPAPVASPAPPIDVRLIFPAWFKGAILALGAAYGYQAVPSSSPAPIPEPVLAAPLDPDRSQVLGLPGYHLLGGTDAERIAACVARGGCPKHGGHASAVPCLAP